MSDKLYGSGSNPENPFFPDEKYYEGKDKTIMSPHGSILDMSIEKSNVMDERLRNARDIKGGSR